MLALSNDLELSGRGSLPHKAFQEPASPLSLASAAASPVRLSPFFGGSSEGLCSGQFTDFAFSASSWMSQP